MNNFMFLKYKTFPARDPLKLSDHKQEESIIPCSKYHCIFFPHSDTLSNVGIDM